MNNTPSRFSRTEPGLPSRRWVVCALLGLTAVASVQAAPPAVPNPVIERYTMPGLSARALS